MLKICGLWKRKTKEEKTFYVGNIDVLGLTVFIFQNKSDNPKAPALDLFIAKSQPQEAKSSGTPDVEWGGEKEEDDPIPF